LTISIEPKALLEHTLEALEELKGKDLVSLDVSGLSDFTDWMVLVSGTSNRHVRSMVDNLLESSKSLGIAPLGVEGREESHWVLVDFGDVVVHVMQDEARGFYDLERLWSDLPKPDSETTP